MPNVNKVADHYTHGSLTEVIKASLGKLGKDVNSITTEDLGSIDEFHIGGRPATRELLDQLNLSDDKQIIDVGCGLGGAARFAAEQYGASVTGVDLTQEYIDTGNEMSKWVKLDDKVTLKQGSAIELPTEEAAFDGGFMIHVGMNIEDKTKLLKEIYRVMKPGSIFGIYDIMRQKDGDVVYPCPWAMDETTSYLSTPQQYKEAITAAGFTIIRETDRHDSAIKFFDTMMAKNKANGGPPPLGLHILMQSTSPIKMKNIIANLSSGLITPVEIIIQK